jgi:hypothetical protein
MPISARCIISAISILIKVVLQNDDEIHQQPLFFFGIIKMNFLAPIANRIYSRIWDIGILLNLNI